MAIRNALQWIKESKPQEITIAINSDSQSALKAIKKFNNTHPIVVEITGTLISLRQRYLIYFNWIRAHNGDPFNDRADILAKKAATLDGPCYYHLPASYFKPRFRQLSEREWNRQWQTSATGRKSYKYFPSVESRKHTKYFMTSFNLSQFLSGHGDQRISPPIPQQKQPVL